MKKIFNPYLQYKLSLWMLIGVLFLYSVGITIYAINKSSKTQLIAIDQFGTRLVTDLNDKVLENEKYEFIKYFIHIYTNYDSENFSKNVGHATDLMSDEVWSKIEDEYKGLKKKVSEFKMTQFSEINKMEVNDKNQNEFILQINAVQNYRGIQNKVKGEVRIKIENKKRSEINPHGWEVVSLNESWSKND